MPIQIELTHDDSILMTMQADWETLQENSDSDSLFCTWEWMTHWWRFNCSNEITLWLMLAKEGGKLVGIAPLMLTSYREAKGIYWKQLSFLSSTAHVDHWDFIVKRGREEEVIPAFIDAIQQNSGEWHVVEFANILPHSPNLPVLRNSGIDWIETNGHEAPFVSLPDNFETFFSQLSSNKRQKQRRYTRKIEKAFGDRWQFDVIQDVDQVEPTMKELIYHHQTKWHAIGQTGMFETLKDARFYTELAKRMASRGWLWLSRLQLGDEVAGVYFGFCYRGRVSFFNSGLNQALENFQPGHVMHEYIIRQAIEEGMYEYDFMWGDENYKFSWGTKNRIDRVLTWYATPKAKLAKSFVDLVRAGTPQIKSILVDMRRYTLPFTPTGYADSAPHTEYQQRDY